MKFDIPLSVPFRSKIVGNKFYTLNGEEEVTSPYYSKHIHSVDDLSEMEINYILVKYSNFNRHVEQMKIFINKMKI